MQLLIQVQVLTALFFALRSRAVFDIDGLPSIENCGENVWLFPFKRNSLTQSSCNNFTVELVFHTIVKEYGAPLHLEKIGEHLNQPGQVEFNIVVERDIPCDVEKGHSVLQSRPSFQEKVIFCRPIAHHLSHECNHSLLHHVGVKSVL